MIKPKITADDIRAEQLERFAYLWSSGKFDYMYSGAKYEYSYEREADEFQWLFEALGTVTEEHSSDGLSDSDADYHDAVFRKLCRMKQDSLGGGCVEAGAPPRPPRTPTPIAYVNNLPNHPNSTSGDTPSCPPNKLTGGGSKYVSTQSCPRKSGT